MQARDDGARPCVQFIVAGIVQGVGFRFFAHRVAMRLGVVGYVRNRPDGTVQVVARAPREVLEEYEALLREGPSMSQVTSVEREYHEPGDWTSFEISH